MPSHGEGWPLQRGRVGVLARWKRAGSNEALWGNVKTREIARNNFKNPFKDMRNLSREEKMNNLDQFDPVNDTLFSRYYNDSINKRALQHMVQELHNNSVRVIIINMLLDPLSSKKISDETLDNYRSYVNALGVSYHDFLKRYPSSSFFDTSHMNVEGRTAFSHDMAQVLAREAGQ